MSADIDCLKNTCECANHDGLLYLRIGERLEKELATAKAENGRLVEVFKKCGLDDGHLIDCPHGDRLAGIPGEIIGGGCSENCQRVNEALSTSNALKKNGEGK